MLNYPDSIADDQRWLVNKFLSRNDLPLEIIAFLFENHDPKMSDIRVKHIDPARKFMQLSEEFHIFPPKWVSSVAFTNKSAVAE